MDGVSWIRTMLLEAFTFIEDGDKLHELWESIMLKHNDNCQRHQNVG